MVRWCIRLTRLTLVCEAIRYRLVQVWQNLKKRLRVGGLESPFSISSSFILLFILLRQPASAFLYLILFHSPLHLTLPTCNRLSLSLLLSFSSSSYFANLQSPFSTSSSFILLFILLRQPAIAFLYLFLFHSPLHLTSPTCNRLSLSHPLSFSSSSYFLFLTKQKLKFYLASYIVFWHGRKYLPSLAALCFCVFSCVFVVTRKCGYHSMKQTRRQAKLFYVQSSVIRTLLFSVLMVRCACACADVGGYIRFMGNFTTDQLGQDR